MPAPTNSIPPVCGEIRASFVSSLALVNEEYTLFQKIPWQGGLRIRDARGRITQDELSEMQRYLQLRSQFFRRLQDSTLAQTL